MMQTQNKDGDWVQTIPEPFYYPFRKQCPDQTCEKRFWTLEGYRSHYALVHILKLD
jgi:hypothetical protein